MLQTETCIKMQFLPENLPHNFWPGSDPFCANEAKLGRDVHLNTDLLALFFFAK